MRFKVLAIWIFVILDVAFFPFSCGGSKKSGYCIFSYENVTEDICIQNQPQYVTKLQGPTIYFPTDLNPTYEGYEIDYWYLNTDDKVKVSFPYTFSEEDKKGYYQGYRESIVFFASWKQVE